MKNIFLVLLVSSNLVAPSISCAGDPLQINVICENGKPCPKQNSTQASTSSNRNTGKLEMPAVSGGQSGQRSNQGSNTSSASERGCHIINGTKQCGADNDIPGAAYKGH